jgi:hypothetical protein
MSFRPKVVVFFPIIYADWRGFVIPEMEKSISVAIFVIIHFANEFSAKVCGLVLPFPFM